MNEINTNRPRYKWRIENNMNLWNDQYWHNLKITVWDNAEEAKYDVTMTFDPKVKFNEEKYWIELGKKISELMDNLELASRLKTITKKE